jgi:hypothetical protein
MDLDDDAPPELVEVSGGIKDSDEGPNVKVPITIVTGEAIDGSGKDDFECLRLTSQTRLSRCRKDDVTQLYPYGTAWQEDCRHHER